MPIGTLFEADGFTEQQYDAVLERVQQVLGDAGPEGCLVHIAGPTGGGWRVIEVWESEEAQRRFQDDVLNPAFEGAGTPRGGPGRGPAAGLSYASWTAAISVRPPSTTNDAPVV
jgi:hypothetical protein